MDTYRFCVVAKKIRTGTLLCVLNSKAVTRREKHTNKPWKIWRTLFVSISKTGWPPGKTFLKPHQ